MMDLRLTTDELAPAPIPFPGRDARHAPGRGAGRRLSSAPGRLGGLDADLSDGRSTTAAVERALERVQSNLDDLFEQADEWAEAAENPLPMKQWRWDPDNGPRAA